MMSRLMKVAGLAAGLVLASALLRPARAQTLGEAMAYTALTLTPTAGLPSAPLTGNLLSRPAWGIRYGHTGGTGIGNNVAVSWFAPLGEGQFSLSAGTTVCDGCSNPLMLGADMLLPITNGGDLQAGLRPAVGVSRTMSSGSTLYYAGALSMPISWIPSTTGTQFVPFIEPGVGFGGMSDNGVSESGTRLMTSGGVAITAKDSPISVLLTARKVFIRNAETMYGLGVTFGGR